VVCAAGKLEFCDKENNRIASVTGNGYKWEFVDYKDDVVWTIKTSFRLGVATWELYHYDQLVGKTRVKAFVRLFEFVHTETKFGRGSLTVIFNESQTELRIIKPIERKPTVMATFNTESLGKKVAETDSGRLFIAKGELRDYAMAVSSLFLLIMQEFVEKPSRFKKRWSMQEVPVESPTSSPARTASSSVSVSTPQPSTKATSTPRSSTSGKATDDDSVQTPSKKSPREKTPQKPPKESNNKKKKSDSANPLKSKNQNSDGDQASPRKKPSTRTEKTSKTGDGEDEDEEKKKVKPKKGSGKQRGGDGGSSGGSDVRDSDKLIKKSKKKRTKNKEDDDTDQNDDDNDNNTAEDDHGVKKSKKRKV